MQIAPVGVRLALLLPGGVNPQPAIRNRTYPRLARLFADAVDVFLTVAFAERDFTAPAVRLPRLGACERTFDRRGADRDFLSDRFFGMMRDLFQPMARSERKARGMASTSP